jgi:uncharacterized membrane protein (UPF0127 family)
VRSLIALGVVLAVTVAGLVALALFLGSLSSDDSDEASIEREPLTIVTTDGEVHRLQVEIADTAAERTAGLSGRETIEDGTGMLFISPNQATGFWMKDTPAPLSIAFLARCGEIVDIQDMQPQSLDLHNTDTEYLFGLEVPQGWFAANGIETGDLVSIPRDHRPDGC